MRLFQEKGHFVFRVLEALKPLVSLTISFIARTTESSSSYWRRSSVRSCIRDFRRVILPARSPCAGAVISVGVLGVLWRGVVCCSMSGISGLKDRPELVVINGWLGPADQPSCEV